MLATKAIDLIQSAAWGIVDDLSAMNVTDVVGDLNLVTGNRGVHGRVPLLAGRGQFYSKVSMFDFYWFQ